MISTADVVRERAAGDDPLPAPLAQEPPAEGAAPTTTPPAPSGLLALSQALYGAQREAQDARARAGAILEQKSAELAPQIEGVQTARQGITDEMTRRQQALEATRPNITPPPSIGLSTFLAPREGEAPESLVSKMIAAVGLFATGIGGLAAGDARGSLAALTGALKGWQDGDRERADRALADWKAKTDAALKAWELERTSYEDRFKLAGVSVEQMMAGLTLAALKHDNAAAAEVFKAGSIEKAVEFFQERDKAARELEIAYSKMSAAQADAAIKGLPERIRAELMANPEVQERVAAGLRPTPEQMRSAITAVEERDLGHKVEVARQQGLYAAQLPQRTPIDMLRILQGVTEARSKLTEMGRLADRIDLASTVGGLRPWINRMVETWGPVPFPISDTTIGTLTPDQQRFLSFVRSYADDILRLKSGAAINEDEAKRMLGFLVSERITPEVFRSRLGVEQDQMRAKADALASLLSAGGYRAPAIRTPGETAGGTAPTGPGKPPSADDLRTPTVPVPSMAPTGPQPPARPWPAGFPEPAQVKGRRVRNPATGEVWESDGVAWRRVGG